MSRKHGRIEFPAQKAERCRNPWNGTCGSTDIAVYIQYRGERLPLCERCWAEISEKDIEWGSEGTKRLNAVLEA